MPAAKVARRMIRLARSALERVNSKRRRHELAKTRVHIERPRLVQQMLALGLETGDVVFLHSSMKSLGYVEGGATTVLLALMEVVGPTGTVVVPTYYLPGGTIDAACRLQNYVFDPRLHGTTMGAVPEAFLK